MPRAYKATEIPVCASQLFHVSSRDCTCSHSRCCSAVGIWVPSCLGFFFCYGIFIIFSTRYFSAWVPLKHRASLRLYFYLSNLTLWNSFWRNSKLKRVVLLLCGLSQVPWASTKLLPRRSIRTLEVLERTLLQQSNHSFRQLLSNCLEFNKTFVAHGIRGRRQMTKKSQSFLQEICVRQRALLFRYWERLQGLRREGQWKVCQKCSEPWLTPQLRWSKDIYNLLKLKNP